MTRTIDQDIAEGKIKINGEWLVLLVDECTCEGIDQYGHEMHRSGCGEEPLAKIRDLIETWFAAQVHALANSTPAAVPPVIPRVPQPKVLGRTHIQKDGWLLTICGKAIERSDGRRLLMTAPGVSPTCPDCLLRLTK